MIESLSKGPLLSGLPEAWTEISNSNEEEMTFNDQLRDQILEDEKFSGIQKDPHVIKSEPQNSKEISENSSLEENNESNPNEFFGSGVTQSKFQGSRGKIKPAANEKEKVIRKFMDSFESELSIPPTRIVEAMAKLKTNELQAPASETIEAVVKNLNLNDEDRAVASRIYSDVVKDFNKLDHPLISSNLSDGNLSNENLSDGKSKSEVQRVSEFEITPQVELPIEKNEFFKANESLQDLNKKLNKNEETSDSFSNLVERNNLGDTNLFKVKANKGGQALEDQLNIENIQNVDSKLERMIQKKLNSFLSDDEPEKEKSLKNESSLKKTNLKSEKGSEKNSFSENFAVLGNEKKTNAESALSIKSSDENILLNHDIHQNDDINIQQIIKQADYLIKNGGGEMKVRLHPEGLGELQIKVTLNDGKLNLSMKADNDKAKKVIEDNILDLKSSLSTHQVTLESVDVGTAGNSGLSYEGSSDLAQNQQNQSSHQNDRGAAQEYWNQFHQNFGSSRQQRDTFFEVPALKGYGKKAPAPLEPIDVSSVHSKHRQKNGMKGLDLVA